jgi:ABC-type lipoprotein release transport system permease subunit
VVGEKLAEKLRLRLRSKLVLTFQTTDGQLVSASFRVAGIYKSINTKYDELNVFVRDTDLQSLLGKEGVVHEIAVLLNDNRQTVAFSKDYAGAYPKLLVQWWGEIMPELQLAIETFDQIMGIIIFIILLALAFGIINTMLMAVLERVKELGMLMAVGMNRKRVFLMIMYETIMLMVVGAPLGLLMGYFTITGLGQVGIDLSHWGEGLSSYGFNAIIYPKLEGDKYLKILVQVVVVTLVSALIPARRALKLNPVDAIRTA